MQTQPQLSNESLATLIRNLEIRAAQSGTTILGSQLGVLINQIIFPQNCRDFGGLREFVGTHLTQYIKGLGVSVEANDYQYQILLVAPTARKVVLVPPESQKVVGEELWRFYTNPNLVCTMAALVANGEVLVSPNPTSLPENAVQLNRIEAEEYIEWAADFSRINGLELAYQQAIAANDFYKEWIPALRKSNISSKNFLKMWEILRADRVANRLTEDLLNSGIDPLRVTEIVDLARPFGSLQRIAVHAKTEKSNYSQAATIYKTARSTEAMVVSEISQLRQLLHRALDVMSLDELHQIRVSAETWMKISERSSF